MSTRNTPMAFAPKKGPQEVQFRARAKDQSGASRQNAVGGRGSVSYKYRRIGLGWLRCRRQSGESINRIRSRENGDRNVEQDADGLVRRADHAVQQGRLGGLRRVSDLAEVPGRPRHLRGADY